MMDVALHVQHFVDPNSVCVCVCVCACVRACVRACVCVCRSARKTCEVNEVKVSRLDCLTSLCYEQN